MKYPLDINTDVSLDRGKFITEADNSLSRNLDTISTTELVDLFVEEDKKPQLALELAKTELICSIDLISERLRNEGRLFYLGAGTSGRLAVLDASECPPTFCTDPDLVQAIIAGGQSAFTKSSENTEDSLNQSIKDLQDKGFNSQDCLIGITAGGTTPYVLSALDYSKQIKALTITITCVPKEQANFNSDVVIRLITGPELLSGSTRLKAGTATKMALNTISTGIMIKLGKVYRNKMIDVSVKNQKLLDRSIRIITSLLNISRVEALKYLRNAGGSVKVACIMKLSPIDRNEAISLLEQNDNQLGLVLNKLKVKIPD